MQRIGWVLVLAVAAATAAWGAQGQGSSQSDKHDPMQQHGSMTAEQTPSALGYKIVLLTEPESLNGGQEATFHVTVTDANGKSVSDATVKSSLNMPAMPEMKMAAVNVPLSLAWDGTAYSGKAKIPFAGRWSVRVKVLRQDKVIASESMKLTAK